MFRSGFYYQSRLFQTCVSVLLLALTYSSLDAVEAYPLYLEIPPNGKCCKKIAEHFLEWASVLRAGKEPEMPFATNVAKIDLRTRLYGIAGYSDKLISPLNSPFITTPYLLVMHEKSSGEKAFWNKVLSLYPTVEEEIEHFLAPSTENGNCQNGRIVGYCMLTRKGESLQTLVLFSIYIDPKMRRKGYGSSAIQAIKKHAKKNKYRNLALEVYEHNVSAKAFYEKHGFRHIHTEQCENPKVIAHRMECRL